ncbi:hypothetical protein ACYPKM_02050 [Pseudomonas aeruginosa]
MEEQVFKRGVVFSNGKGTFRQVLEVIDQDSTKCVRYLVRHDTSKSRIGTVVATPEAVFRAWMTESMTEKEAEAKITELKAKSAIKKLSQSLLSFMVTLYDTTSLDESFSCNADEIRKAKACEDRGLLTISGPGAVMKDRCFDVHLTELGKSVATQLNQTLKDDAGVDVLQRFAIYSNVEGELRQIIEFNYDKADAVRVVNCNVISNPERLLAGYEVNRDMNEPDFLAWMSHQVSSGQAEAIQIENGTRLIMDELYPGLETFMLSLRECEDGLSATCIAGEAYTARKAKDMQMIVPVDEISQTHAFDVRVTALGHAIIEKIKAKRQGAARGH